MILNGATIRITDEKSPVEVRRKSAKMPDFLRTSPPWGLFWKGYGLLG